MVQKEMAFEEFNNGRHGLLNYWNGSVLLTDFLLTVKAATLIFIHLPGCGSAISSAGEGKSGSIYNLVKN